MSTDVIIGHFLKSDDDISTIIHSDRFVDTVIDSGNGFYFSNHGNTVFHWSNDDIEQSVTIINNEIIKDKLIAFKEEISGITNCLDMLEIGYEITYGAKAWYN